MIRFIQNQTRQLKSLLAGHMSTAPHRSVACRTTINLATTSRRLSRGFHLGSIALTLPLLFLASGPISIGQAEVALDPDKSMRIADITPDLGALGTEKTEATMACWQGGKEVFSAAEFNTVLLGELAGASTITLKNMTNGTQALAISLDNGLCFVTIEP